MAHMTPWVRQYALRDLLDDSFDLFKERATALLLGGLLPYALLVPYVTLMRLFVIPGNLLPDFRMESLQQLAESPRVWIFLLGFLVCLWVAYSVGYIVQCRIATRHALGEDSSVPAALRLLAKPFWSLLVVGLAVNFAISLASSVASTVVGIAVLLLFGLLSLFSPLVGAIGMGIIGTVLGVAVLAVMLYVAVYFLTAPTLLAVEHQGPFAALGRSFRIAGSNAKAHCMAVAVITHVPVLFLPVLGLLGYLGYVGTQYVAPTTSIAVTLLVSALNTAFFTALLACLQALAYIDGRSRIEAFDLLMLARQIGLGEELEQALKRGIPVEAAYPNYATQPAPPAAPQLVTTQAVPGLTQPGTMAGYPDYAAPPPAPAVVEALSPTITPDSAAQEEPHAG